MKEWSKEKVTLGLSKEPNVTSIVGKSSNGSAVSPLASNSADDRPPIVTTSVSAPAQVLTVTAEPEPLDVKSALVTPPESPPTKPLTSKAPKQNTTQNASNNSRIPAAKAATTPRSLSKATAASTAKGVPVSSPAKSQPVAKPLKPQLTGQSTTSNAPTIRSKSRAGASAPSTPSTNRTLPSRPKTPSSGLYAPTAASLAKAKGVQPPVPTTRKVANAAAVKDVMERLSKPTAASASRSRTPAPAPASNAARARTASTATPKGVGAAKPAAVRPKTTVPAASNAAAKAKLEKERKQKVVAKSATAAIGAGVTVGATTTAVVSASTSTPDVPTGPETTTAPSEAHTEDDVADSASSQPAEEIESYDDDFLDETVVHDHVHGISEEVRVLEAERSVGDVFNDVEGQSLETKEEEKAGVEVEVEETAEVKEDVQEESKEGPESSPEPEVIVTEQSEELAPYNQEVPTDTGDDLVNLVKMLERPPNPASDVSSIPDMDHAGVIPDDEL